MKFSLIVLSLGLLFACATTNQKEEFTRIVETSCGECNFQMTGDECDLAVKIDGKYYFVEGSAIHEHGDAHAEDGLCTVVREAKVTGRIKGGVFVASSFELIKE
jgi:hypothetical protein